MRIAVVVFVVSLAGCTPYATRSTDGPCDIAPLPTATEEQRCVFIAVANRCNVVDECLVHCWNDGVGEGVGGGCHHLCWGSASLEWSLPKAADSCLNNGTHDPCEEQIVDEDRDGKVTMRDRYIREYELTQKGLPICVTYDRSRYMPRYTFEFDSAVLDARVVALLDEDVETLKRYPNLVVEVVGHADSRGSDAYNQELSLRRARAAYEYLVKKGVSVSRLRGPIGFGESRPVSPNTTSDGEDNPEGRARNRRIELNVQE